MTRTERKKREKIDRTGETKEQRFVRVCSPRVNKVIKALDSLGKTGSGNYSFTEDQVGRMFAVIGDKLNATVAKFDLTIALKIENGFSFDTSEQEYTESANG